MRTARYLQFLQNMNVPIMSVVTCDGHLVQELKVRKQKLQIHSTFQI